MRFIVAIFSFLLAFTMIGLGVAQRTIWAEPDQVLAEAIVSGSAPITFIDGSVLNTLDGRQKIEVSGTGDVFAAYGRTADVLAWIGDAAYNAVEFDPAERTISTRRVSGAEAFVPDPRGADVWLDEYSRAESLSFVMNAPEDVSLVLLTDGINPAPAQFSISWPLDNRTPWSGPLIVGGVLLLLMGIGLYVWALTHFNRSRGPRRKPPKPPKQPKRPTIKARKALNAMNPIPTPAKGRRAAGKSASVVASLVAASVILTGCATGDTLLSTNSGPSASPSSESSAESPSIPPAVTESQMKRILSKISLAVSEADAAGSAELAAKRFTGPALEMRVANYAVRAKDSSVSALPAIPSTEIKVLLPQRTEKWPRTVFTIVQEVPLQTVAPSPSPTAAEDGAADESAEATAEPTVAAPQALVLVQETPRDNFKIAYAVSLSAGIVLPELSARDIGTARLQPSVRVLKMAPEQLALAYGDIVLNGAESQYWNAFDIENDKLLPSIGTAAKDAIKSELPSVATITFANAPGESDPIAMSTTDAGALVAVYLTETETVTPTEQGAQINTKGIIKALSGVSSSHRGTTVTYGDQLLFYVPPANSDGKIVLIGFSTHLLTAEEL